MSDERTLEITVRLGPEPEDAPGEVSALKDVCNDRDRTSFATSLNAGLKEKLKSYSFEKDVHMADIINSLIEDFIEEVEEEEGEIEVYKAFKVEDS